MKSRPSKWADQLIDPVLFVGLQGVVDFHQINTVQLQAKHLSYVVKQYGPIEGLVDSHYRLSNDANLQVTHLVNGSVPQTILTDGKMASKMILHQTIPINNYRSIAYKFWIQLEILNEIKETVELYKQSKDPVTLCFRSLARRLVHSVWCCYCFFFSKFWIEHKL